MSVRARPQSSPGLFLLVTRSSLRCMQPVTCDGAIRKAVRSQPPQAHAPPVAGAETVRVKVSLGGVALVVHVHRATP